MEIRKDIGLYCDSYIESSELRNTEDHYQERYLILQLTIDGIKGLMTQNADKEVIIKQMALALKYYDDLKGRKAWFKETEPELYACIKVFLKNKRKINSWYK